MGFFDVSERWAENYSGRIAVEDPMDTVSLIGKWQK